MIRGTTIWFLFQLRLSVVPAASTSATQASSPKVGVSCTPEDQFLQSGVAHVSRFRMFLSSDGAHCCPIRRCQASQGLDLTSWAMRKRSGRKGMLGCKCKRESCSLPVTTTSSLSLSLSLSLALLSYLVPFLLCCIWAIGHSHLPLPAFARARRSLPVCKSSLETRCRFCLR